VELSANYVNCCHKLSFSFPLNSTVKLVDKFFLADKMCPTNVPRAFVRFPPINRLPFLSHFRAIHASDDASVDAAAGHNSKHTHNSLSISSEIRREGENKLLQVSQVWQVL
jgi:hypothetical protein